MSTSSSPPPNKSDHNASPAPPLIIVAHGSSDPDWRIPFERLRQQLESLCPGRSIYLAFLERQTPGLIELVENLYRQGSREIIVTVALMSGGGRHAKVDLPQQVDKLQKKYTDLRLYANFEPLGQHHKVIRAMAQACLERSEETLATNEATSTNKNSSD